MEMEKTRTLGDSTEELWDCRRRHRRRRLRRYLLPFWLSRVNPGVLIDSSRDENASFNCFVLRAIFKYNSPG